MFVVSIVLESESVFMGKVMQLERKNRMKGGLPRIRHQPEKKRTVVVQRTSLVRMQSGEQIIRSRE